MRFIFYIFNQHLIIIIMKFHYSVPHRFKTENNRERKLIKTIPLKDHFHELIHIYQVHLIYDEIIYIYDVVHLGLGRRQLRFSQKY